MVFLIQKSLRFFQISAPGVLIVGCVAIARTLGLLEPLELSTFDYFLRLRPTEPIDERIVVLKIDNQDIERLGGYPISSAKVIEILTKIEALNPRVIGLSLLPDLVQDNALKKGRSQIKTNNLIVAEKILPPQIGAIFRSPEGLRVGFSDLYLDGDLKSRRALLGTFNPLDFSDQENGDRPSENQETAYRFSFSLQLAELYLRQEQDSLGRPYRLNNGISDQDAMRFGDVELPRVKAHTGGYVGVDDGGVQLLINYRHAHDSRYPFHELTLREFEAQDFDADIFDDQIVIIGVADPRVRPQVLTQSVNYATNNRIDAIDIQAHTTSQIISAVLDSRTLIVAPSRALSLFWIIAWGTLLTYSWRRGKVYKTYLRKSLLIVFSFLAAAYLFFLNGIWMPVVPVLIIAVVNILIYVFHSKKNQILKQRLQERQSIIENTFDIIHNGPLQELSSILRFIKGDPLFKQNPSAASKLIKLLGNLDYEIREIGESLKNEALLEENSVHLLGGEKLDLSQDIHELFYYVFSTTLNRNIPEFETIKIKVRDFEPVSQSFLDFEDKRLLCLFLEEALCNVAKHTQAIEQIKAVGKKNNYHYVLCIEDKGLKLEQKHRVGNGSKQAQKLASRLGGTFFREAISPKSVRCQISWPLRRKLSLKIVITLIYDYFGRMFRSHK